MIQNKIAIEEVGVSRVDLRLPYLAITDLNPCVPIVVNALEEGDMQLLATMNGVTKVVKCISTTAYNVEKLLRVTRLDLFLQKDDAKHIETVIDYLEAMSWKY